MKKFIKSNSGQALVTILFIGVIGITVATAAAVFILQNMKSTSITEQGVDAYYVAESGIQEALIRKLRDSSYSGTLPNQPLSVGGGSVIISTTSSGLVTAIGTYNGNVRKIQVQTVYNNGVLTISSWKEIK